MNSHKCFYILFIEYKIYIYMNMSCIRVVNNPVLLLYSQVWLVESPQRGIWVKSVGFLHVPIYTQRYTKPEPWDGAFPDQSWEHNKNLENIHCHFKLYFFL